MLNGVENVIDKRKLLKTVELSKLINYSLGKNVIVEIPENLFKKMCTRKFAKIFRYFCKNFSPVC